MATTDRTTRSVSLQEDRIDKLEKAFSELNARISKCEVAFPVGLSDVRASFEARETVNLELEGRIYTLEGSLRTLSDKVDGLLLRFEDYAREWPAIGSSKQCSEASAVALSLSGSKDETVSRHRSSEVGGRSRATSGTDGRKVVVVGDSLARGAGHKLKARVSRNVGRDAVEVKAFGGAKLRNVADEVDKIQPDRNTTLVVVAGANNLEEDSGRQIEDGFEAVLTASERVSKSVVMVGLIKRYDLGSVYESKRIVLNCKLRAKCRERGISYLEYEPERSRLHSDGLHLNPTGQEELGLAILMKCRSFLA